MAFSSGIRSPALHSKCKASLTTTDRKGAQMMTKRIRVPVIAATYAGKVRLGGIRHPLPLAVADSGRVRVGGIAPIV